MLFSEWDKIVSTFTDCKIMLGRNGLENYIIIYEEDTKYMSYIKEICNYVIKIAQDKSIWEKKNV